jgi:hypothetical protein
MTLEAIAIFGFIRHELRGCDASFRAERMH